VLDDEIGFDGVLVAVIERVAVFVSVEAVFEDLSALGYFKIGI
jgi:hypothetical protein